MVELSKFDLKQEEGYFESVLKLLENIQKEKPENRVLVADQCATKFETYFTCSICMNVVINPVQCQECEKLNC